MNKFIATILFTILLTVTAWAAAISPDGSVLMAGASGSLVTSAGTWTIGPASATANSPILLGGVQVGGGAGTEIEVANGGQMYANTHTLGWWVWSNGAWVTTSNPNGTSTSGGMTLQLGAGSAGSLVCTSGNPAVCTLTIPQPVPGAPGTGGLGCQWHTVKFTDNPHLVTAGDNCEDLIWKGSMPVVVELPVATVLGTSFVACYQTETQALSFSTPSGMEGSPAVVNHGDNPACVQVDSDGVWDLEGGAIVSSAAAAQ